MRVVSRGRTKPVKLRSASVLGFGLALALCLRCASSCKPQQACQHYKRCHYQDRLIPPTLVGEEPDCRIAKPSCGTHDRVTNRASATSSSVERDPRDSLKSSLSMRRLNSLISRAMIAASSLIPLSSAFSVANAAICTPLT